MSDEPLYEWQTVVGDRGGAVWPDGVIFVNDCGAATTRTQAIEIAKALLGAHGVRLTGEICVVGEGLLGRERGTWIPGSHGWDEAENQSGLNGPYWRYHRLVTDLMPEEGEDV